MTTMPARSASLSPVQTKSERLYERALRVMPGGVSRNAVLSSPHPSYLAFASGCWITDVEGKRRLDVANNMASLIHGHAHPAITESVTAQLARGTASTFATEVEIELAEHLVSRCESIEQIRFVNSGTEAVLCCLKAARAWTRKRLIAKVEGAYHGIYDYAEVSQTSSPATWGDVDEPTRVPVCAGTPKSVLDDVVVIPFNDPDRAIALLDRHADDIACVLIDPLPHRVGMTPASKLFIERLRAWTSAHRSLLVFDEVITFRSTYGGAQGWYSVKPDLTALGKIIGGGFPVGAIGGRAEVMEVLNPRAANVLFPHSGTFSANPITMTAGLTAMRLFDERAVERLNGLGDRLRRQLAEAIAVVGAPASVSGAGSMFRIHLTPEPPREYRAAYDSPQQAAAKKHLLSKLFDDGVILVNSCSGMLSTPMGGAEIDQISEAFERELRAILPQLTPGRETSAVRTSS